MKTFYRVVTYNDEAFDFPAGGTIMSFVNAGKIDGGFAQEGAFIPYQEMRLVLRIQTQEPVTFMAPAGNA
jgi:hypothetical protein